MKNIGITSDYCQKQHKISDHEIRRVRRSRVARRTTIKKGMLEARTIVTPSIRAGIRTLPFAQPMSITRPGARGIHECGADVSDLPGLNPATTMRRCLILIQRRAYEFDFRMLVLHRSLKIPISARRDGVAGRNLPKS